jgi:hypothetical protein
LNVNIEEKKRVGYGSTLKDFFYEWEQNGTWKEMKKCFSDTRSEFKFLFYPFGWFSYKEN